MVKGRELRGLYGTKRLVNFLYRACDYPPPQSSLARYPARYL
jgi:hypothetical protein